MTNVAEKFWSTRDEQDTNSMNDMFGVLSVDELLTMREAFVKLGEKMEELNS